MRDIKFRAWDKESKSMRYNAEDSLSLILSNKQDFELMQYTGLKDKAGVEIYEGDIVKCIMQCDGFTLPHMGEIAYAEVFGAFATKNEGGKTLLHNHQLNSFEVIGNIYEKE